jgi:hypothetical protein
MTRRLSVATKSNASKAIEICSSIVPNWWSWLKIFDAAVRAGLRAPHSANGAMQPQSSLRGELMRVEIGSAT